MRHSSGLLVIGMGSLLLGSGARAAEAPEKLVYQAPGDITFTVTADGLSSIRLGDRELAAGGWHTINAEGLFKAGSEKVVAGDILEKSLTLLGKNEARVRQAQKDLITTFDYTFNGEDVTIRARVENNNPTENLAVTGFQGLQFHFKKPPHGYMLGWHFSYLQHVGLAICHPGFQARIGGSCATDDTYGVGVSPLEPAFSRTLIHWDRNWGIQSPEADPGPRSLDYYVPGSIPPGGARTFGLTLRVSTSTDWRHLMQPYKNRFMSLYGPQHYKADHRLLSQGVVADQAWIKPDDPYGFQVSRRLDLPPGIQSYIGDQVKALKASGGQGLLLWAQGGADPRGAMYRPDFDILPPEVEANWPILRRTMDAAGLRFGVAARPGEIAYRLDWKSDATLRINPDDPDHLRMMDVRFKKMMDHGCTLFYLDTFGSSLEDVRAMQNYREKLGPDIQTFVEHPCDLILPYSGAYIEVSYQGGPNKDSAYALSWGLDWFWEFARWLLPDVGSVVAIRKEGPKDAEPVQTWLFRHHLTPLVPDWNFGLDWTQLKAIEAAYVDEKGAWRN